MVSGVGVKRLLPARRGEQVNVLAQKLEHFVQRREQVVKVRSAHVIVLSELGNLKDDTAHLGHHCLPMAFENGDCVEQWE